MSMRLLIFAFVACCIGIDSYNAAPSIRSVSNKMSYDECDDQCSKNPQCKAFTWDMRSQICSLKSRIDGPADLTPRFTNRQMRNEKRDASGITVQLEAGLTKDTCSVKVMGSMQHVITDEEVKIFSLGGDNLKNAVGADMGKKPDSASLRSSGSYSSKLYNQYAWDEVTTVLVPIQSTVLGFTSTPVLVDEKISINDDTDVIPFTVSLSTSLEDTVESSWSITGTTTFSQSIDYKVGLPGAGEVGGSTSFSFSQEFGKSGSNSKTITVGTTHGATINVKPGESSKAQLMATKGTMKVRIFYEMHLTGCTAVDYSKGYKGHHYWCLDIGEVMQKGGLSNSKKYTQDIEIGYFGSSTIIVSKAKPKTRSIDLHIDHDDTNGNSKRFNEEFLRNFDEENNTK